MFARSSVGANPGERESDRLNRQNQTRHPRNLDGSGNYATSPLVVFVLFCYGVFLRSRFFLRDRDVTPRPQRKAVRTRSPFGVPALPSPPIPIPIPTCPSNEKQEGALRSAF